MHVGPYGGLDPEPSRPEREPAPLWPEVGPLRVLLRGLRKRCPRCAERRIFASWFRLRHACPRCGLVFERETGGFLGAMTVNYVASVAVWIAVPGVWLAFTVPDVPVGPMLAASAGILVVVSLWFFPRSKGIWASVEYLALRTDPDYRPPVVRDPRTDELE
jgi:uncharacterized protein (DUF983 family)